MSLWYESLLNSLRECGSDVEKRAMCVIDYLSMPVPRSWWERAIESGTLSDSYIGILNDSLKELSCVGRLKDQLSYGQLIALAFRNEDVQGEIIHEKTDNRASLDRALEDARQVFLGNPELIRLSNLIRDKSKQLQSDEQAQ